MFGLLSFSAVGMVGGGNKSLESGGEFSMQQEDFPALPGSNPGVCKYDNLGFLLKC